MLDIGFLEMATIGVVALVVIGPERLPAVAAKVGRYVGKAQKFVRGVRSDISRELETGDLKQLIGDQKNQIDELRQIVNTATKDIQSSTKDTFKGVEDSMKELKSTVDDAASTSPVDANDTGAALADKHSHDQDYDHNYHKEHDQAPELLNDATAADVADAADNELGSNSVDNGSSQQNNKAS